jgi:hypothetical protein
MDTHSVNLSKDVEEVLALFQYAMNFPVSRIIRIGAQLRHNANRAKQKGSIKLLRKLETSYPFQLNFLIELQDLIRKIIQKDVSELSLL